MRRRGSGSASVLGIVLGIGLGSLGSCHTQEVALVEPKIDIEGLPGACTFDVAKLEAIGAQTFTWEHEGKTREAHGVPLEALLRECGFNPRGDASHFAGPATKNEGIRRVVIVRGADAYEAVFSTGEVTDGIGSTRAWICWEMDGVPLPPGDGPLRLIAPTDASITRWVRGVTAVRVQKVGT